MSCGMTRNTAAPPWPCSGFITTAPCSSRKALISSRSREIRVGGISCGKFITNSFSGALRTLAGSFTTSVLGCMPFEKMRRGDVGEIERRVLPQQDDIEGRQRLAPGLAEGEMVAGFVAHGQHLNRRDQLLAAQRQLVGRVIGQPVAALLRLQQQRKGRIAADVDARDGVHLDGDVEFHGGSRAGSGSRFGSRLAGYQVLASNAAGRWRGRRRGAISMASKRKSNSACSGCVISQPARHR